MTIPILFKIYLDAAHFVFRLYPVLDMVPAENINFLLMVNNVPNFVYHVKSYFFSINEPITEIKVEIYFQ